MVLADTPFGLQPTNPFPKIYKHTSVEKASQMKPPPEALKTSENVYSERNGVGNESNVQKEVDKLEKGDENINGQTDIKPSIAKPKSMTDPGLKIDNYANQAKVNFS